MKRIIHSDLLKYLRDYQHVIRSGFMPKYHAVLCDPPYYLGSIVKRFGGVNAAPAQAGTDGRFQRLSGGFMGQTWDGFDSPQSYQAWVTAWAEMLLDYVYPGGVLIAFGGTRTYHRLVSGLEDAGWEIYDSIMAWTYGSGFPKSYDISKGIDKAAGAEREIIGTQSSRAKNTGDGIYGAFTQDIKPLPLTAPATLAPQAWQGYGTALKPSYEPIVLARAPRIGYTYADCATQFGSGALNIDKTRIKTGDNTGRVNKIDNGIFGVGIGRNTNAYREQQGLDLLGRFPANTMLVHHPECNGTCHPECHVRIMGEQSGETGNGYREKPSIGKADKSDLFWQKDYEHGVRGHDDIGTAARFFYQAKAASWERSKSNLVQLRSGLSPEKAASVKARLQELNIQPVFQSAESKAGG